MYVKEKEKEKERRNKIDKNTKRKEKDVHTHDLFFSSQVILVGVVLVLFTPML